MKLELMNKTAFINSKALWKLCFPEDGDAFVDWYYRTRTKPQYALGAFFEDEPEAPAAMMHLLPRRMLFGGKAVGVCFVAGVATHPAHRGRGLCSALYERAFELMRLRGFAATVLQPFDTGFYERFGYKTYAYLNKITLSGVRPKTFGRSAESVLPEPGLLARHYNDLVSGREGYCIRGREYYRGFTEEFSLPSARLFAYKNGYCAGYEEGDGFTAYELAASSFEPEAVLPMLPEGYDELTFFLPEDADTGAYLRLSGVSVKAERVPFCMLAPLEAGFYPGCGSMLCIDRY